MANNRFVRQVCSNTKSDLIEITEDKLENILIKFLRDYKKTIEWIAPFGLFLSFLATLLTAEFKDFLEIPKETWCAIFYILMIISLVWTIYSSVCAINYRKKTSLEYLIEKIKYN